MSKIKLFLKLADTIQSNDNSINNGKTRKVFVNEFIGDYLGLQLNNGAGWARLDGSFGKKYDVKLYKEGRGNKITAIQLLGFNEKTNIDRGLIRSDIREAFEVMKKSKKQYCPILGTNNNLEIDHKDGRKKSLASNKNNQKMSDFELISRNANLAKRSHCSKCEKTNIRYDARKFNGKILSYSKGGKELSKYGCEGCYLHDPKIFERTINSFIIQYSIDSKNTGKEGYEIEHDLINNYISPTHKSL